MAGTPALPGPGLRSWAFPGVPAAGRPSDGRPGRLHPDGGAGVHRRGVPRGGRRPAPFRPAERHRHGHPSACPRRGRATAVHRRGPHQTPGQGGFPGGQARWPGRSRTGRRSRVPGPPARGADMGGRAGDQGPAGGLRHPHYRRAGGGAGGAPRPSCRADDRRKTDRLGHQRRPPPHRPGAAGIVHGGPGGAGAAPGHTRTGPLHARLPGRPGGEPATPRRPRRPHRHRTGALPRPALGDPLDDPTDAGMRHIDPDRGRHRSGPCRLGPTSSRARGNTAGRVGFQPRCPGLTATPAPGLAGAHAGHERVADAARWGADRSVDAVRARFGHGAVGYAAVVLSEAARVPDEFRELAEHGPL